MTALFLVHTALADYSDANRVLSCLPANKYCLGGLEKTDLGALNQRSNFGRCGAGLAPARRSGRPCADVIICGGSCVLHNTVFRRRIQMILVPTIVMSDVPCGHLRDATTYDM